MPEKIYYFEIAPEVRIPVFRRMKESGLAVVASIDPTELNPNTSLVLLAIPEDRRGVNEEAFNLLAHLIRIKFNGKVLLDTYKGALSTQEIQDYKSRGLNIVGQFNDCNYMQALERAGIQKESPTPE